jgi:hypothetical protein
VNDIERLRELLTKVNVTSDGDFLHRLQNGYTVAYNCAVFIRECGPNLLADYERLRGMEERVKGAAVGEWRGCEQSWKAGGSVEVKFRVLDINYHAPMRVALVPVPGGE